jgi:hypothetical protein
LIDPDLGAAMIERIVTGGQSGADQGAWRAARAAGIATGGWMPKGFATEEGPRPEFARLFGAREHESTEPADRTVANVETADGTLVFAADCPGPGTALTIEACRRAVRPFLIAPVDPAAVGPSPEEAAAWVVAHAIRTLNVAGERESTAPGIGARVEAYLADLLRRIQAGGATLSAS